MWKNPALLTLWGGDFTSRVGESIFQIALLWYLLEVTQSSLATGLITMISFIPALVVGVWAGVLVDRWDLRRVLWGADAVRALLALALLLLGWAGALPLWAVAALAFLLTSASAFFNPARDAIIPTYAPPEGLFAANALVQTAWQFSLLVGPFLAAILLPFIPTLFLFGLVGTAFLASLAVLLRLPGGAAGEPSGAGGMRRERPFGQAFREGFRALWRDGRVFWIWVITGFNNFFLMGPVIVGVPVYVKVYLGGSGSHFALVEGTYAGGMILSTWLLSRFAGRFHCRTPERCWSRWRAPGSMDLI